jgi:hypothetical protein
MSKILLTMLLVLALVLPTKASGVRDAYNTKISLSNMPTEIAAKYDNAMQLATLRVGIERKLEKTSKLSFTKRLALKSALNKVKKAEKTNADINSTLMTIGIILMIVGLVLLVLSILSIAAKGGTGTGGGGGLIVLGLILWLVGKFVDL